MKRIVAVLLTAILLISCLPLTAMAAKPDTAQTSAASVEQKFRLLLEDLELVAENPDYEYFYEELGQYPAKNPEWILISGGLLRDVPQGGWSYHYAVFGNKLIRGNTESLPFKLGYGVYDVKSGAFYDLIDAWDMNLNRLRDVWDDIVPCDYYDPDHNAAENAMYTIGDADVDGEVTILDATRIQRCIAELDENPWKDFAATGSEFIRGTDIAGATDYDRDGDTTVMDATRIQRTIAELPSVLTYQVKWSERSTTPDNFKYREKYLVTDRSQLHKDYPDEKRMLDDFDDSFFEDHMLVGANLVDHMEKYITTLSGVSLDTTGTLNIDFRCKPASTVPSVDMHYSVCLELSKAFLDDIKDIKVNIEYIKPEDPTQMIASIVYYSEPAASRQSASQAAAQGYRMIDSQRNFANSFSDTYGASSAFYEIIADSKYREDFGKNGFLAIVKTPAQFKYLFPNMDATGYDEAFFKKTALVVLMHQGDNYNDSIELSHLAVKGDTLYGQMAYLNMPGSSPMGNIYYDVHKVSQSDVKNVKQCALWDDPMYSRKYLLTPDDYFSGIPEKAEPTGTGYQKLDAVCVNQEDLVTNKTNISYETQAGVFFNLSQFQIFNDEAYYPSGGSNAFDEYAYLSFYYRDAKHTADVSGVYVNGKDLEVYLKQTDALESLDKDHLSVRILKIKKSDLKNVNNIRLYSVKGTVTATLYTEITPASERKTVTQVLSAASDHSFISAVDLESVNGSANATSALGDCTLGRDSLMLIKSKQELNRLFPGLKTAENYDEAFFKDYAIVAVYGIGSDTNYEARISDIAVVNGNTLYADARVFDPTPYLLAGETTPPVWTFKKVKQSEIKNVDTLRCWNSDSVVDTIVPEDKRVTKAYIEEWWDPSGKELDTTQLTVSSPSKYEVSWQSFGLAQTDSGWVLLIRNRRDFERYLPGFDKEKKYDDDFFSGNAIIATLCQGFEDDAEARNNNIGLIHNILLVNPTVYYPPKYDENGVPYEEPTAPICWTFCSVRQSDVKNVSVINCWKHDDVKKDFEYVVNADGDIEITKYIGSGENVSVPASIDGKKVVAIRDSAFTNNQTIKSVVIPDTVKKLGNNVFSQCLHLQRAILATGVTTLGDSVFYQCVNLNSVSLPNTITTMGKDVFRQCSSLTSVDLPRFLNGVPEGVFYGCSKLTSFKYPDKPTYIGSNAFRLCSALKNYTIPYTVERIASYAYANTGIVSITIPENVLSIGNSAFNHCSSLKSVNMSETVESIGSSAFYACSSLESFSVPAGVTRINSSTFAYCTSLKSFSMWENVNYIGEQAFSHCTSLPRITISSDVVEIGASAFEKCTALKSLSIPRTVKTVGAKAAKDCTALERVTFAGEVYPTYVGVEIPPVLNEIVGESAFEGCTALTNVTMPDEIKTIGKRAFYGCTKLDHINLPASLTAINEYTFANCESLWTLNRYGDKTVSLKTVGNYAFFNCESLEYVKFDNTLTSLGNAAFRGCNALSEVTLEENLKTIGADAFLDCNALKKLTVPKSVTTIGKNALGYTVDEETNLYVKRADFTIRGYVGSAAQTYANSKGFPFEAIDAADQLFTADITDDKKVGNGTYGTALAYEELTTDTRVFEWDYQKYGDGKEFLSQPYRFAIIRSMEQYNAYFTNERFENINANETDKPIYQVINGKNTAIDESFFEENALIVGVGYLHTGDEYLYFDEIQQSADGKSLWFRFNRYTYGDINPYLPYAANILGYCFAAAKVPKAQVKDVENVYMLPQIKRLPTVTTPLNYGNQDPVIPANALDDGYKFIPENEIFLTAPYDVGRYGLGYFALDDEWQMGHILLIRSMAEFKKHFPGFEISKDYFNENALVAMVNNFGGICSEYTCSLSCIAVKDDLTLYVNPQTTNVANFEMSNGIFDPMMVSDRETCHWTFHRVSQQDVAKVGEIKTWRVSGQQPLGKASNVRKDVEGYKLVGGLGDENMAIRVTSPEELETALDRVFTDKNGHKVDRSGFSYADKLKSADYYKTNGLVVMRVHRGAHNTCFDILPIHEQFTNGKLTGLSVDIMRYVPQQSAAGDEYDILLLRITNVPFTGDLTVNTYDQPTPQPIDIDWAFYERV